jgi:branched-chain amino acid transport system permease protein
LIAAAVLGGLLGVLIGLPVLRLRGLYLALGTLAFGELVRAGLSNAEFVGGTRGFRGMAQVSEGLIWACVIACLAGFALLSRSRLGLMLRAVRDDEVAADAIGLPTTWIKVGAFALGSSLAGLGGGLDAHYTLFIEPAAFGFTESITITLMLLLGGFHSVLGPIVGAVLWMGLPELLRPLQDWRGAFFGAVLVVLMIVRPAGLVGSVAQKWTRGGG